jgi:hypothetical protein
MSGAPCGWGNGGGSGPHQHAAVLVGSHPLGVDKFVLKGFEQVVIELEAGFESAV